MRRAKVTKTAVFLVACFHLFNNTFKIKMFWNKINFKTFLLFGIPSIIFAFIGAMLISVIRVDTAKRILAIFLIIFSIYSLIKPKFKIKETKITAIVGGSLSGFCYGSAPNGRRSIAAGGERSAVQGRSEIDQQCGLESR